MSTSTLALAIAGVMVFGLIGALAFVGLFMGAWGRYWGKPKLGILRSQKGSQGFAFALTWGGDKNQYNSVRLKLFNPFGKPQTVELAQTFPKATSSFALDLDMGPGMASLLKGKGADKATLTVELESAGGENYAREFRADEFFALVDEAQEDVEGFLAGAGASAPNTLEPEEPFWTTNREFIADTVPGKGAQLAVPTNPAFAAFFQGGAAGGASSKEAAEAQENFAVTKVWIEDGCIVCNACEDIYPEVFKVIADGCEVRPGHPMDDGLKVEEAAEACPVEIIKFARA